MSQSIDNADRRYNFHYRVFLSHKDEPHEAAMYSEDSVGADIGLLRSNFFEKRKLRRTAKRLRRHAAS
jgi:hypothetical protein